MAEKIDRRRWSLVQLTLIRTLGTLIRGIFIACAINYLPLLFPTSPRLSAVVTVVRLALGWEGLRMVHNRLFGINDCDCCGAILCGNL